MYYNNYIITAYKKQAINILALWRVLDIKQAARYARRQAPATNRHNATKKANRETAEKAKRRRKSGGAVNPMRTPRFFYAAAILAFSLRRVIPFGGVIRTVFFCMPFTFRNLAATVCAVLLLFNTFCTANCLSMPPHYFLLCGIIVYA